MSTIAFIGLGAMGRPMAEHLLRAGHTLHVYARRPEAAQALVQQGARIFASPALAAAEAEFICTNVTSTADVEEVLLGEHGVATGPACGSAVPGSTQVSTNVSTNASSPASTPASTNAFTNAFTNTSTPRRTVLDFSTIDSAATRRMAARLAERGIDMLDCPVSGGVTGARAATLSIMVGGKEDVLQRALPVLQCLGQTITHIGGHGAGQIAKACNQIVQVVNIQGIAEALRYARANGLEADGEGQGLSNLLAALQAGMAGSKMLDLMGPKMIRRDFAAGIEARLHDKDFGLIVAALAGLDLDLPAVQAVARQLRQVVERGWGRDDTSSLLRLLE